MSRASSTLFHTQISALMNLHRFLPARVVRDVLRMDLPIASQEGFVRHPDRALVEGRRRAAWLLGAFDLD